MVPTETEESKACHELLEAKLSWTQTEVANLILWTPKHVGKLSLVPQTYF